MAEKKRILVVDDEPQITRVLRTALTGSGYEVRTANDGHAGLRSAREWQPDLVITDISMPNMNGIELCRQLRAESALPIIVLSVKGEEKTKVEALDAGRGRLRNQAGRHGRTAGPGAKEPGARPAHRGPRQADHHHRRLQD